MKEETRKKLDAIQFMERKKRSILYVSAIALFLMIAAVFIPIDTATTYGITKGFTDKHTEIGISAVVSVTLESGELVLADFPKNTPYVNNANVELIAKSSLVGYKTYRIVNYVK